MIMPINEKTLNVFPVKKSPPNAPTRATGSENMIAKGVSHDSYSATISM